MSTCSSTLSLPLERLSEPMSLALAQQIQWADVLTPLAAVPITTSFVQSELTQSKLAQPAEGDSPILLLHGFDSSVLEFRRLLPELAAHHPTWAIDLLGFGFTNRQPHPQVTLPFSPEAIKTHLYYCWKTWIREPVTLVGASMGGAAAIDFALGYPEAVKQLVLIDSAGVRANPSIGKMMVAPVGYLATAFLRNLRVRQNISLKAYHDPSLASPDALNCGALHLDQPGWQQALIAFTRSGGYGSFQTQLAQLSQPTLILWGAQDQILGTADATIFQQSIPRSQLVWIEACGHVPHLEKPQVTAEHILNFIL